MVAFSRSELRVRPIHRTSKLRGGSLSELRPENYDLPESKFALVDWRLGLVYAGCPAMSWSSLASEAAVDLMNPVGAGGRTVGGGRKAGLDKGGSTQHAAYLGGGREESNRNEIPARRIDRVAHRASQ